MSHIADPVDPERWLLPRPVRVMAPLWGSFCSVISYLVLLARLQIVGRLRGKVDPADLVQDTFLEAHCHFGTFRGVTEAELACWLRQILCGLAGQFDAALLWRPASGCTSEQNLADRLMESSRAIDQGLVAPNSTPSQGAARREQAVLLANCAGPFARRLSGSADLTSLGRSDVSGRRPTHGPELE